MKDSAKLSVDPKIACFGKLLHVLTHTVDSTGYYIDPDYSHM